MKMALELASMAEPFPNPKVGAVLVQNGRIIGRGFHKAPGKPHAEIEAIKNARENKEKVSGAILYVTLEPCAHKNKRTPPCTEAIIKNRIKRVVFAMEDPNPLVDCRSTLERAGIEVVGPTNEKRAALINRRYIKHISKRPFVTIKMAMSADGKSATRTGDSKWISSEKSRQEVLKMRAKADAVMVGSGTIKADNPRLTARTRGAKDPYRVIVDSDLCIPLNSKVLQNTDEKTIIATAERAPKKKLAKMKNVFVCGKEKVDLQKLVLGLSAMGIKNILIEGGGELNASALEEGIVDKLCLFIAPKIIGGKEARGIFGGKGIALVKNARKIKKMKSRNIGCDILLECWL